MPVNISRKANNMKSRMSISKAEPRKYKIMDEADKTVETFDLDPKLKKVVKVGVFQLNGC